MFRGQLSSVKKCVTVFKRRMSIEDVKKIFQTSVAAVLPAQLIKNDVRICGGHLLIRGQSYDLKNGCYLVGFGKAVLGMTVEIERILGCYLERGVVTVPKGIFETNRKLDNSRIEFVEGAKDNLPDREAEQGAIKIKDLVEHLSEEDLLIVLISGGGSALLPLPISPITLEEKQQLIKDLAKKGANIYELNTVRKQLSALKGGGLARLSHPCKTVSLILSDIVGDPLGFIASGPTMPNTDPLGSAMEVLKKYRLDNAIPESIKKVLEEQENAFLRKDIPIVDGEYEHSRNYIIGNNKLATEAALRAAQLEQFQSIIVSSTITGEVQSISRLYAQLACHLINMGRDQENKKKLEDFFRNKFAKELQVREGAVDELMKLQGDKGICLIFAGEPTVEVRGSGKGGRNQQLALAFSLELNNLDTRARESADILFLSCGTDGIDGPTDAAGAVSDFGEVKGDINPREYLDNNDCYTFYERYNGGRNLIKVGHTGTNVMDVHLMVVVPKGESKVATSSRRTSPQTSQMTLSRWNSRDRTERSSHS